MVLNKTKPIYRLSAGNSKPEMRNPKLFDVERDNFGSRHYPRFNKSMQLMELSIKKEILCTYRQIEI